METKNFVKKLRANGLRLFSDKSYDAKHNAQRNLDGKTHYVDEGTLKYFKCRILKCRVLDDGLILGIIESLPIPEQGNCKRVVFFDIFGNVIGKSRDTTFKTTDKADQFFWKESEKLDAIQITLEGLQEKKNYLQRQINDIDDVLKGE